MLFPAVEKPSGSELDFIAGLVLGVIAAGAIFIIILVICMKNYNRRHRTVGTVIGSTTTARTNIAVTNTTHTTGIL
jgi:hypothetical protein